jgi:hypothetical protein
VVSVAAGLTSADSQCVKLRLHPKNHPFDGTTELCRKLILLPRLTLNGRSSRRVASANERFRNVELRYLSTFLIGVFDYGVWQLDVSGARHRDDWTFTMRVSPRHS